MNNNRKYIQIAFFAIGSFLFVDSNAQGFGYEYDSESFDTRSVGIRSNVGRIVSSPSSTVNQYNVFQNSAQSNRGTLTNQFQDGGSYSNSNYDTARPFQASNTNGLGHTNQGIQNSGYQSSGQSGLVSRRPSISVDNNNNHNSEPLNQRKSTQESLFKGPGSSLNEYSNSNGASSFNRPTQRPFDRTSANNNDNGINVFQSTSGQANQRRPVRQDSSENVYPNSLNSYQSQQTLDRDTNNYNNDRNSGSNFQGNGQSNQRRPTNQKGGGSTLGIIAANDGYVQTRPSKDLERSTYANSNPGIQSNNYETNGQSNSGNNYQSNFQSIQGRPVNRVEGSDNNRQNNGHQFFDSENFEDSHESNPVHSLNKQKGDNGNNGNNKNKNNNHGNKNGNGNSNGNGNGNKGNKGNNGNNGNKGNSGNKGNNGNGNGNGFGEKRSFSDTNNNKNSQTSASFQGNKAAKKTNPIALANSNKKKINNNNGGNNKKRVSQIKYEQYLTSIFPDLDNEQVQEVKDFHGRQLARPGQFPHMGAIGFKNHVLNKTEYKCGASLISDIWAITTAHCTKYNGLSPTYVRFGDLNLKAGEENVDPQTRQISLIVNHPSYDDDSLYNDIALLQLDKVVLFTEFVQPIRIWYMDEIPFTMAYAMGFGAVQFAGAQTNRLTQLELTIIPNDVCARQMPQQSQAKRGIIDSQICAIDNKKTESDTFQGDSGGPLEISFFGEEGGRQREYLIGMTSFGAVGTTRLPGVYTRISSYVDWIEKTVWSSEYNAQ